ncbi:MAG: SRPBCC domain-containing protein [Candidatus Kapaibacterium sp.]
MGELKSIKISMEIPIKAGIRHVWDSLINNIGLWWRKDFYTSSKTKNFILEPMVGGRMFEDYGNDEGLLWGEVIVIDSPVKLEIKGHLSPQFGGPAMNFLTLSLEEKEGLTFLTLTDSTFGDVSESTREDLTSGWKMLFEEGFKNYVEDNVK